MARTKGAYNYNKWRGTIFADDDRVRSKHTAEQLRLRDHVLKHYGMTVLEYVNEFAPSHCPICQDKLVREKRGTHLDHDHATLEIRGIICRECNIMLGKARDNPFILINAVKYLNKGDLS